MCRLSISTPPSSSMMVVWNHCLRYCEIVIVMPSKYNAGADYSSRRRQLVVIPAPTTRAMTSRYSGFKLPRGWSVEVVPRSNSSQFDKYYYEPGTGNKFRSLRAVERYIKGEGYNQTPRALTWNKNFHKSSKYRRMIVCGGKLMRLNKGTLDGNQLAIVASGKPAANSPYNLPDGWVIEQVPRRDTSHTDKYYYEPGSGRKFRSLIAVQRYISELGEDVPLSTVLEEIKENNIPLSKAFKLNRFVKKNPVSCKKQCTKNNTQTSSFVSPPMKVNWVLASPQGDIWNPFIFDSEIPDSIKQQWNERFMLAMNVDNSGTPNCI